MEAVPPDGRYGGPLTLVLALRADFYAECAGYPLLRQALESSQHYIGAMNRDELRQAIVGPATAGGWEIEPGLADLLVRDAGDEPGALPLLSHALLETWRGRSGRTLTLKGYAAAGGVRGAIAKTADTITRTWTPRNRRSHAASFFASRRWVMAGMKPGAAPRWTSCGPILRRGR